jgi:sec-independent protein translocase protein TatA
MGFGWTETLLIFGIILLIFGPNKLPELARSLGNSINIFKEEMSEAKDSLEETMPSDSMEAEAAGIDSDRVEMPNNANAEEDNQQ